MLKCSLTLKIPQRFKTFNTFSLQSLSKIQSIGCNICFLILRGREEPGHSNNQIEVKANANSVNHSAPIIQNSLMIFGDAEAFGDPISVALPPLTSKQSFLIGSGWFYSVLPRSPICWGLHYRLGLCLHKAFPGLSLGRPESCHTAPTSYSFHDPLTRTMWKTPRCQVWLPAWDAAFAFHGPQLLGLTLERCFAEDFTSMMLCSY